MRIYYELNDIQNFEFWAGAVENAKIVIESDKSEEAFDLLESIFPDGCSEGEFNDIFRFYSDELFDELGIPYEK